MSVPARTPAANGFRSGSPSPGGVVDHLGGHIGVAADPPQAREVLHRGGDPGGVHALGERGDVARDGGRIRPVAPAQHPDRLVVALPVLRHDVGDRSQVGVDADPSELPAPPGRVALQLGRRRLRLSLCRGDAVEALPRSRCT